MRERETEVDRQTDGQREVKKERLTDRHRGRGREGKGEKDQAECSLGRQIFMANKRSQNRKILTQKKAF
jgi:hypothetical protein